MPLNIELKARADNSTKVENIIRNRLHLKGTTLHQTDTFFKVPKGRLKLRCDNEGECEIVYYDRTNTPGPVVSHYFRKKADNPESKMNELKQRYGVKNTVTKKRTLYVIDNARIHLDDVEGLGRFIEIEIVLDKRSEKKKGQHFALRLMKLLGIENAELLSGSYDDMLGQQTHNSSVYSPKSKALQKVIDLKKASGVSQVRGLRKKAN